MNTSMNSTLNTTLNSTIQSAASVKQNKKKASVGSDAGTTIKRGRFYMSEVHLSQFEKLESLIWNYDKLVDVNNQLNSIKSASGKQNVNNDPVLKEIIFKIFLSSASRKTIYEYFRMTQSPKCCALLKNEHKPFEHKIYLNPTNSMNNRVSSKTSMSSVNETVTNATAIIPASIHDEKMTLYYSTLCALYPSLYPSSLNKNDAPTTLIEFEDELSSSPVEEIDSPTFKPIFTSIVDSVDSASRLSSTNTNDRLDRRTSLNKDQQQHTGGEQPSELETTSEGLCDHLREVFDLDRQVYNDYQVKAMRKLLIRKSHGQILKEELSRQLHVIETDKHPLYKQDSFQSEKCYSAWKENKVSSLRQLITNFSHIQIDDEELIYKPVLLDGYLKKLKLFPTYYEILVKQIFKSMSSSSEPKLSSNSKRVLKEFQLRYCVDSFDAMIIELKYFLIRFQSGNMASIDVLVSYLKQINFYLDLNRIQPSGAHNFPINVDTLFGLISVLENAYATIVDIFKDLANYYPDGNVKSLNKLIELLQEIAVVNDVLNRTSSVSVEMTLKTYLKIGFQNFYKQTREHIQNESRSYDSNLLYSLIVFSRDTIEFYKKTISKSFSKFLDVNCLIVKALYECIMNDVKSLFEDHLEDLNDHSKLNLNLLALAYRLNQFDQEFGTFIRLEDQIWRVYFLPHMFNWISALGNISSRMIYIDFIPNDHYREIPLNKQIDVEFIQKLNDSTDLNYNMVIGLVEMIQKQTKSSELIKTSKLDNKKSAFKPFVTKKSTLKAHDASVSSLGVNFKSENESISTYSAMQNSTSPEIAVMQKTKDTKSQLYARQTRSKSLDLGQSSKEVKVRRANSVSNTSNSSTMTLEAFKKFLAVETKPTVLPVASSRPEIIKTVFNDKPRDSIQSVDSTISATFSTVSSASTFVAKMKASQPVSSSLSAQAFPCSTSIVDLLVLMFRYKETCEQMINLIIPSDMIKHNQTFLQAKFSSLNGMYHTLYKFIEIYSNNIMSLDICATNKRYLIRFFGQELIEELFSGKIDEQLWGCRHKLKNSKNKNCHLFIDRNTKYISDRFEPISSEMCTRLNNIVQLKEIQRYFYSMYNKTMQKFYDHILRVKSRQTLNLFQKFKMELYKLKVLNKSVEIRLDRQLNGLLSLLTFRLNLFCKKAKLLILTDKELNSYPLIIRLKPLLIFLTSNFNMLRNQLNDKLFFKFIKILWNSFHESFTEFMQLFDHESSKSPKREASVYLKTIELLLQKFKEYSTHHSFLEAKIKQLRFILSLYSEDSNSLILLYYKLFNFNISNSSFTLSGHFDLVHLVKISKKLKKPFHGKFLVKYLRSSPPFSEKNLEFGKDDAIRYAQNLLEANYLISVENKNSKKTHARLFYNLNIEMLDNYKNSGDTSKSKPRENSLSLFNYDNIYLATKTNWYRLNLNQIEKLTENLLFKNTILNQELEILYPAAEGKPEVLTSSKSHVDSNYLFEKCLENWIDQDFVMKIMWHRVYEEPIVMRFISLRQSNYFYFNQNMSKVSLLNNLFYKNDIANSTILY